MVMANAPINAVEGPLSARGTAGSSPYGASEMTDSEKPTAFGTLPSQITEAIRGGTAQYKPGPSLFSGDSWHDDIAQNESEEEMGGEDMEVGIPIGDDRVMQAQKGLR